MSESTILFSSILREKPEYKQLTKKLFDDALAPNDISYTYILNTRDIWVRDFLPVKTKSGGFVSFRYEPGYHESAKEIAQRTNYRLDLHEELLLPDVRYSEINLDGGNVVFSPSKSTALISDRIFPENPKRNRHELVRELEQVLETRVIIIPSLPDDFTGHADGTVRFAEEQTVVINNIDAGTKLEQTLRKHGLNIDYLPFFDPNDPYGISAVGCYLNFLETKRYIFLPIFGLKMDAEAILSAERIFKSKTVIPVNIKEVAEEGGGLNCISWEL